MLTLSQIAVLLGVGFLLGAISTRAIIRLLRRWKARRSIIIDSSNALQIAAKYANDGIVIQDLKGHVEWLNPAYTEITGYHLDEMFGKKPQSFIFPKNEMPSSAEIAAFHYDTEDPEFDKLVVRRNRRKDGTEFWNQMSVSLAEVEPGMPPKVVVVCRDISQQVAREEALRQAERDLIAETERDNLTGAANRLKLNSFLEKALLADAGGNGQIGLIALDLDRFKQINDEIGHAAGDAVLVRAVEIMMGAVSNDDLVSRMGGDEFIIVCPGVRGFADLRDIGQSILSGVSQPFFWEGQKIEFGVSIGALISEEGEYNVDDLLRRVDMALYAAKEDGRGRLVCFDDAFKERVSVRQREMLDLSKSLRAEAFEMAFQPIVEAETLHPLGFEALIRWQHPKRGVLPPGAFFDLAEELDAMERLDRIAITKALDGAAALQRAWPVPLAVGINVSPSTLARPDFVDTLKWELDKRDLSPHHVVVEVLETTIIRQEEDGAVKTIEALNEAGIDVALDDFGVGYAGLAHLARLQLRHVKIDKSLIADVLTNPVDMTITRSIIELCEKLDRNVIAEGIETAEQAEALIALGVPRLQGYGVARPMPLAEIIPWLTGLREGVIPPEPVWQELSLARHLRGQATGS